MTAKPSDSTPIAPGAASARKPELLKPNPQFLVRQTLLGAEQRLTQRSASATARAEEPRASREDYERWAREHPEQADALQERIVALARGAITPAELYGLDDATLADVARLGARQLAAGQLGNAEAIFLGLITADPNVPVFHVSLGQVYLARRDHERACAALSRGIELFERLPAGRLPEALFASALLLRGQALARLNRKEEALEDLGAVLRSSQDRLEKLEAGDPLLLEHIGQVRLMIEALQDEVVLSGRGQQKPGGTVDALPLQGSRGRA